MSSKKKKNKASQNQKKEDLSSAASEGQNTENEESAEEKFEQELNWCIEQILLGFEHQNPNSKQACEAVKVLKILKSDKAPMIKKRQAMRNTFGDYRQKMKVEERKSVAKLKKMCLTPVKDIKGENSCFFKKSSSKQGKCHTATCDDKLVMDCHSEAGSSSQTENTLITDTNGCFKFQPSDNSFAFHFGSEADEENPVCTCSEINIDSIKIDSEESNQQAQSGSQIIQENQSSDLKMIETDNNFKFDFQT